MNTKSWLGLVLMAAAYGQLLFPRRLFAHPSVFFHGYPVLAGNILAMASAFSTLGVILLGEGICERFRAPSLLDRMTRNGRTVLRFLASAALAGVAMEALGQWLGKLWIYPYWTVWFYWLVVIPGFAFYWTAIAESYLAVKAVLDSRLHGRVPRQRSQIAFGLIGAALLVLTAFGYGSWYSARGGYFFASTRPVEVAPPFRFMLLGFVGALLLTEWALGRKGTPSFFAAVRGRYWVPTLAIGLSSVAMAVLLETLNAVDHFWAYTHFPWPGLSFAGVQLIIVATWPLQYLTFLLIPSLMMPALADLFWTSRDRFAQQ